MAILRWRYEVVTKDWKGIVYPNIHNNWDYPKNKGHLFIPGYIIKALIAFQRDTKKTCHTPHPYTPPSYNQKVKLAKVQKVNPFYRLKESQDSDKL